MAVTLESQITVKFLQTASQFWSSKRIKKVLNTWNMIVIGKVIYRRNYCKIKITEDSIEQKQLVNGSI